MNSVIVSGRVSNLASLKIFGENEAIAYIPLAVDREYLSKEKKEEIRSQGKNTADFIKIKITGKNAIFYADNCFVGRMIEVKGRLEENNYEYFEAGGTKVKVRENVIRADRNTITFLSWESKNNKNNSESNNNLEYLEGFGPTDDVPF